MRNLINFYFKKKIINIVNFTNYYQYIKQIFQIAINFNYINLKNNYFKNNDKF